MKRKQKILSLEELYNKSTLTHDPDRVDTESGRCILLSGIILEKFLELVAGKTGMHVYMFDKTLEVIKF